MHTPEDELTQHAINRRLLGGLYVPDHLDESVLETTAPIDVVDQRGQTPPLLAQPPRPRPSPPELTSETSAPDADQAPMAVPDIEAPPELVMPPEPTPHLDGMIVRWSNLFPKLVWLSVIAGLAGQIYGWSKVFGGGPVAIGVAITLGGTFEFIMVSASSRGLRDIGRCRPVWQVLLFLTLGTACAAVAFWMNLDHFAGDLAMVGVAAAGATAVGYIAHVLVHLFDELDNRSARTRWERERDRVQREIDARAAKARADYDAFQDEVRRVRTEELRAKAAPPRLTAAPPMEPTRGTAPRPGKREAKPRPQVPAPGEQATKQVAIDLGVRRGASTPSKLKAALTEAGYALPKSSTTVENWCRDIRQQLQACDARS